MYLFNNNEQISSQRWSKMDFILQISIIHVVSDLVMRIPDPDPTGLGSRTPPVAKICGQWYSYQRGSYLISGVSAPYSCCGVTFTLIWDSRRGATPPPPPPPSPAPKPKERKLFSLFCCCCCCTRYKTGWQGQSHEYWKCDTMGTAWFPDSYPKFVQNINYILSI